jgi:uncharacterized protein
MLAREAEKLVCDGSAMGVWDEIWLALAALAAGAINAIAGGGTLLTFPALNSVLGDTGEAARMANIVSTLALCPGSLASSWGYRKEFAGNGAWIRLLIGPSLIGGLVGSLLLVVIDPEVFKALVPWLILTAAILFALQPQIAKWLGIGKEQAEPSQAAKVGVVVFQFLVAVYGGYFGAGIGILMLSSLALMGIGDIHRMNAIKTLLAAAINGISVVVFVWREDVHWTYTAIMAVAAIAGGYFGARIARQLDKNVVRWIVVSIGFGLAGWYFYKQFMA